MSSAPLPSTVHCHAAPLIPLRAAIRALPFGLFQRFCPLLKHSMQPFTVTFHHVKAQCYHSLPSLHRLHNRWYPLQRLAATVRPILAEDARAFRHKTQPTLREVAPHKHTVQHQPSCLQSRLSNRTGHDLADLNAGEYSKMFCDLIIYCSTGLCMYVCGCAYAIIDSYLQ